MQFFYVYILRFLTGWNKNRKIKRGGWVKDLKSKLCTSSLCGFWVAKHPTDLTQRFCVLTSDIDVMNRGRNTRPNIILNCDRFRPIAFKIWSCITLRHGSLKQNKRSGCSTDRAKLIKVFYLDINKYLVFWSKTLCR